MKHAGVVSSERASNSDLHRIGRLRSSTITCSWVTIVTASRRQVFWVPLSYRSAAYSALTLSAKMWTSLLLASTTASTGVVRSSESTDLGFLQRLQSPGIVRGFLCPLAELSIAPMSQLGQKRQPRLTDPCQLTIKQKTLDDMSH